MKKMSSIVAFLVALCVSSGLALRCYQCEEPKDEGLACEMNPKSVLRQNCTTSFGCIKYVFSTNTTSMLTRGCAPESKCEALEATSTSNHTLVYCDVCDSPLCNSAPLSHSKMSLWLPAMFVALIGVTFSVSK